MLGGGGRERDEEREGERWLVCKMNKIKIFLKSRIIATPSGMKIFTVTCEITLLLSDCFNNGLQKSQYFLRNLIRGEKKAKAWWHPEGNLVS